MCCCDDLLQSLQLQEFNVLPRPALSALQFLENGKAAPPQQTFLTLEERSGNQGIMMILPKRILCQLSTDNYLSQLEVRVDM